jgi:hypothetical protein
MTKAKLYFTTGNPQEINDLESQNLVITGISTLGITTTTNLTSQQLNVSGISTLGITTTTNLIAQQLNVSGIATVGLGSTSSPQSNSQMSFELISNTNLRVRVRGTDGVIRSSDLTLS